MDVISIVSLGIQVCQGLISYYDGWRGYKSDIGCTYDSIVDLSKILALLRASLDHGELDEGGKQLVERRVQSCEDLLTKLSKKLEKLQKYDESEGIQQKAWAEMQRVCYPFRVSTLSKLREIVDDVRERLKLAMQLLQLGVSTSSQRTLTQLEVHTKDTAARTVSIEASIAQVSAQNQRLLAAQQSDSFRNITNWLSPPDPWTNHASARQRYEPQTGAWLLQSDRYQKWRAGQISHLCLFGKAGCGKTVLCSTVIEDVRTHCETTTNSGHAVFYFSFSDDQKQSYDNLLRSLVVQLGLEGPRLSILQKAYEKSNRSLPGMDDLETILLSSIESYLEVFIVLDALDECPEGGDVRQNVLERLEWLLQKGLNIKLLATSREVRDVRESMETLGVEPISIAIGSVDADIQKWVSTQMSRDRKLGRLDPATKALIEETISLKADGMFRWAYCQLQELKKLKSTKPKHVKEALRTLPITLDATYERILTGIGEALYNDALILLQWLAYARSPPSLGELVEASIIDPTESGVVDTDERGSLEDTFDILSGLVTVEQIDAMNDPGDEETGSEAFESPGSDDGVSHISQRFGKDAVVRLAHFSVKEYLESKRILQSDAKDFYLECDKGHRFIAQSCLTYIMYYSSSSGKTSTLDDLVEFPLLQYAAQWWCYHSRRQQTSEVSGEMSLLRWEDAKLDWLLIFCPDWSCKDLVEPVKRIGSSVYYASVMGLEAVVRGLLQTGSDVNAQGGYYGNALQAAACAGDDRVVRMLIDAGADVNAKGGCYGSALQAVSSGGDDNIVRMLINAGADVNVQGGDYGSALLAASLGGHDKVIRMLIDAGADVNAPGGYFGNALQVASFRGLNEVVQMLMDAGADVNVQGGRYGSALQAASLEGKEKVVQMLINAGADVNVRGGDYGNALLVASLEGHDMVVRMLTEAGAKP